MIWPFKRKRTTVVREYPIDLDTIDLTKAPRNATEAVMMYVLGQAMAGRSGSISRDEDGVWRDRDGAVIEDLRGVRGFDDD